MLKSRLTRGPLLFAVLGFAWVVHGDVQPAPDGKARVQIGIVTSADGRVDATVTVALDDVLVNDFMGIGVQWSAYPWWDISDADWQKVFRRLEFMRMPFSRVMLDTFWYCQGFDENGDPIYTWDTAFMRKLYRLLDWCERNQTTVMIGEWGRPNGKDLDLAATDPRWARIVADFCEHMVRQRGYTCLKYYNLINEPHGWWSGVTLDEWRAAILNLHAELEKRGLATVLPLALPDGDRALTTRCLKDAALRNVAGLYDEHWYLLNTEVQHGIVELYTREQVRQIRRADPGKRFVLGEVGLLDGKSKQDQQKNVFKFWYGVAMADAAIQMIRGGMDGFLAWDLDDAMHFFQDGGESMNALTDELPENAYELRKIWGMWNILGEEHGAPEEEWLRPWYYPWALLARLFPAGCSTVEVEGSGVYQLRVAAGKVAQGKTVGLSYAIVNHADAARRVRIVTPDVAGPVALAQYEYFDLNGDNRVDAWAEVVHASGGDRFPEPTRIVKDVDPSAGFVVSLPGKGVVMLTTLNIQAPAPPAKRSAGP